MSVTLQSLFEGYLARRKPYQKKAWLNFKSFFRRVFFLQKEYSALLASEASFQKEYKEWLFGLFELHNVSTHEAEELKMNIKNFKEKINFRNSFLIAFAALVAIVSIFSEKFLSLGYEAGFSLGVFIGGPTFLVLERIQSLAYFSASEEIANQIECWLKIGKA